MHASGLNPAHTHRQPQDPLPQRIVEVLFEGGLYFALEANGLGVIGRNVELGLDLAPRLEQRRVIPGRPQS